MQLEDFDLNSVLEKAKKSNAEALGLLCEQYYPKILKFMFYRVGNNVAHDLTGDVFLKVMRSIDKQKGNFDAWIYKIARNVIIDRSRYVKVRPVAEKESEFIDAMPSKVDVKKDVSSKLDMEYALTQDNDEQREILVLRFIQGMNNQEVSEITGKSLGAVRAMQFRALSALKVIMKEGHSDA